MSLISRGLTSYLAGLTMLAMASGGLSIALHGKSNPATRPVWRPFGAFSGGEGFEPSIRLIDV